MTYIPLHVTTIWSLLDSTVHCDALADKAKEYNIPAVCLTDSHNLKGVVSFYNSMVSKGIRPIIGSELNVVHHDNVSRITVLAKNKAGYRNLVRMVSLGNSSKRFSDGQPQILFEDLQSLTSNTVGLMGDIMSPLALTIFKDWEYAYRAPSLESCENELVEDWMDVGTRCVTRYQKLFSHFFLFTDLDCDLPILQVLNKCIHAIAKTLGIEVLPCNNIHYLNQKDKHIHDLIIKSSVESIRKPHQNVDGFKDFRLFHTDNPQCHLYEQLPCDNAEATLQLLDIIEEFSIKEKPLLPEFKVDGHKLRDPDEYLYKLCRKGFVDRNLVQDLKTNSQLKKRYGERVKEELATFSEAGLSSYFLMVKDIVDFCRANSIPIDVRGSSTGCLINYLLGISSVDPLRPDPTLEWIPERELDLSRFYNKGRNTAAHVSLPDIDCDVPPQYRQTIVDYLREVYGHDCVAHICTHGRFKGRGAIKEVFRLSNIPGYYDISDSITKAMVDESKISDELAEKQEEDPSYGLIQWNLDNVEELAGYYEQYKHEFDTAVALEKIPKNLSIHAAGFVVSSEPLGNLFPMVYWDKTGEQVVGVEGQEVEQLGAVKLDILGVAALEKVKQIELMINNKSDSIVGVLS
jgi:DNA polymerase-3 subunit alpha